jgi:hypothetical protein
MARASSKGGTTSASRLAARVSALDKVAVGKLDRDRYEYGGS